MIDWGIPPFIIFVLGAVLVPLLGKGLARKIFLVALAIFGLASVAILKPQTGWIFPILPEVELILLQADRLSLLMGYIFAMIGAAAIVYSISTVKEAGQYICALLYMGSALGAVFAGDFFTLYIFWEVMAFSSLGLIWYEGSRRARDAGMRYILFHLFGGGALLAGIIIHYMNTGSIVVGPIESGIGYLLLLIGIGVNTAFIPLHTWLPDSYPKATIAGAVFMSVYTTKTGVYVLARTFSGADAVAYMGGVMVLYGVIFALLQNDVRKLLSYHIVSQVGYMVAGIGIGTYIGVNGGIAHVFNHILYKALLFMCMGAVIFRTGKNNLTELGGLAKRMPVTMITCVIAALSISGVVGFNGYVSKGMVIQAGVLDEMRFLVLLLMLGSVGTLLSFLKLLYFAFFSPNEEIEAKEAPLSMLVPMCVTAFLCFALGVYPRPLYEILPYREEALYYHAYEVGHTFGVLELLLMTVFLFFMLGFFRPHDTITYDLDYLYRKAGRSFIWFCETPLMNFAVTIERLVLRIADYFARFGALEEEESQALEEPVVSVSLGTAVLLVLLFFALYLIVMLIHGWLMRP